MDAGFEHLTHPNRDPALPSFFIVPNHPQLSDLVGPCRALVHLVDTARTALKAQAEWADNLKIPACSTAEQAIALGLYELKPNDYVFARRISGSQNAADDVLEAWVTGRTVITPAMVHEFKEASLDILGPRDMRGPDAPKDPNAPTDDPSPPTPPMPSGAADDDDDDDDDTPPKRTSNGKTVLEGGTQFERLAKPKPVKPGTRCITIASSFESQTSINAPVASIKVSQTKKKDLGMQRKRLTTAAATMAKAAFSRATKSAREHAERVASLHNVPSVGVTDNINYATQQLNIASAQCLPEGVQGLTLVKDLGDFGQGHYDRKDNVACFSHMSATSDAPNCTPGLFHLLEFGLFMVLNDNHSINFCGRRRHGGTPPVSSSQPERWEYRFVVISYPPHRMLDGSGRFSLAALPNNGTLFLTPEMINIDNDVRTADGFSSVARCNRSTYIHDGILIMDPHSHFKFIIRSFLLLLAFLLAQLPTSYNARMDPDLILQAFTMQLDGEERVSAGEWDLAPGHRRKGDRGWSTFQPTNDVESQSKVRGAAYQEIKEYEDRFHALIPDAVRRGPINRSPPAPPQKKPRVCKDCSNSYAPYNSDGESDDSDAEDNPPPPPPKPKTKRKRKPKSKPAVDPKPAPIPIPQPQPGPRKLKPKSKPAVDPTPAPIPIPQPQPGPRSDNGCESGNNADSESESSSSEEEEEEEEEEIDKGMDSEDQDYKDKEDELLRSKGGNKRLAASNFEQSVTKRFCVADIDLSTPVWTRREYAQSSAHALDWQGVQEDNVDSADDPLLLTSPTDVYNAAATCIPFLQRLSTTSILSNRDILQKAWLTLAHIPAGDLGALPSSYAALVDRPDAQSTALAIRDLWPMLARLSGIEALNVLRLRLDRECIMLTQLLAWRWLCAYVPARVMSVVSNNQNVPLDPSDWIGRLARNVKLVLELNAKSRVFSPSDYGLALNDKAYAYSNTNQRRCITENEVSERAVTVCTRIIETWLEFPQDETRRQAWFVFAVLHSLGRAALLLDEVWYGYNHVRAVVVGPGGSRARGNWSVRFKVLREALRQHPLLDTSSPDHAALVEIASYVDGLREPNSGAATTLLDWRDSQAMNKDIAPRPPKSTMVVVIGSDPSRRPLDHDQYT
ncbi:hypothetical protein MKEN_00668800 [Mycena kentingensis (nom. inval.)]|nr:hypothetical protein MKEN_00668800 [Mycena kentingensis (nom. inval.)]